MIVPIDDPTDPRLDDFRNLTDADVRPDRRGIVIAEGVNVVERLVGSPFRMRAVFGVPAKVAQLPPLDVPVYEGDKWLLSEVVGFRVTRGVLASADRGAPLDAAGLVATARRMAVLEGLNDFENLGAVFRNAAAFGLDAVLLDRRCADPLYRRSVRVSMGWALRVPFAVLPSLDVLREVPTFALTPCGSLPLGEVVVPPRWAVLLGAEGPGLSESALRAADVTVRIPMAEGVDSLNVATAAAVAFARLTG